MRNSINFAASGSTTGMFMSLSCYYASTTTATTVPVLSPFGLFTVQAVNSSHVHVIDPAHPAMLDLTDANLSLWADSVHEYFTGYPATWKALAEETSLAANPHRIYIIANR
jgi:hypothetical protein